MKNIKNFAFTLSEVLITMTVIGIVAALTLPQLITNASNKTNATQIKNFAAQIQQLAADQMVMHKTNNLSNTDFSDPAKLVTNTNFPINKTCSYSNRSNCWDVNGYKRIDGTSQTPSFSSSGNSAVLKNGVTFQYYNYGSGAVGYFLVDVNGKKEPNIYGRDLYGFFVTDRGQIIDYYTYAPYHDPKNNQKISDCKSSSGYYMYKESICFGALQDNNWAPIE